MALSASNSQQLEQTKRSFRQAIEEANREDDDPIGSYEQLVKWTMKTYTEGDPNSGLFELLEEVMTTFQDDKDAKGDVRYIKMCCGYASRAADPVAAYGALLSRKIGASRTMVYEAYAATLIASGRHTDADKVYRKGIQRKARPVERMNQLYKEFQDHILPQLQQPANQPPTHSAPVNPQHRDAGISDHATLIARYGHDRYQYIHAPEPVPGKRNEFLKFDLSLLFTKDGTEYCVAEARAKQMGLLGLKYERPHPSVEKTVELNDVKPLRHGNTFRQPSMKNEPTMTLNTKAAFEDVYAMYNSPEKTMRTLPTPGSKNARTEPVTATPSVRKPMLMQTPTPASRTSPTPLAFPDENAVKKTEAIKLFRDDDEMSTGVNQVSVKKTPSFKPFIDTDLCKENITPAAKSQTLATPEQRRALLAMKSVQDPKLSLSSTFSSATNHGATNVIEPKQQLNTFKKPVPKVSLMEDQTAPDQTNYIRSDDRTPFRVFSRPLDDAVFKPKTPTFKPFVDPDSLLTELNPFPSVSSANDSKAQASHNHEHVVPLSRTDDDQPSENFDDLETSEEVSFGADNQNEDDEVYRAPLGGRFGQFNVMTPITERTFELTSATKLLESPTISHETGRYHSELGIESYLPAESKSSFVLEGVDKDVPRQIQERPVSQTSEAAEQVTGTLSLAQYFDLASTFKPTNPCNPFAPDVMTHLLPQVSVTHGFYDLTHEDAQMLKPLQKFALKKSRSSTSSAKGYEENSFFPLNLAGKRYSALSKLGEGGFGAVFAAREISEEFLGTDDFEDLNEDTEAGLRAIKVVKPRETWEFHILRRLHLALPATLCRSIVQPHGLYAYRDESFLVLDLSPQGTLLEIVNHAVPAGISQQGGSLDELLVMFFTIELLKIVEGLHIHGFIHGDLKIDNCLLRLEDVPGGASNLSGIYQPSGEHGWSCKGIKLIDFGRTIETRLFPQGQMFIADWPVDAKDCVEMREKRPWTFQPDYFGLAGIVYCMLFGKYIDAAAIAEEKHGQRTRYKMATPMKRYWQSELWFRLFELLLNPCDVDSDAALPIVEALASLRRELETWLQQNCSRSSNTLKGLLKKIELYVLSSR